MTGFDPPETVYGVDFSASSRDAGRKTWIAEGSVEDDRLTIEGLADAAAVLDCDADRASTLNALVDEITAHADEPVAYGLDFPFGLPEALLDEGDWHEFVANIEDGWGALDGVDSPTALYEQARDSADGDELLRATDEENGGQEPTGYRIKTQTFYGISGVLAEIVDDVSIPPMDDPDGRPLVVETYPACTFAALDGAVRTGYKRDTRDAIEKRRQNVDALAEEGVDFNDYDDYALASDHALDAVAAAYATYRATRDRSTLDVSTDEAEREGYIFGGEAIDPRDER